MYSRSPSDRDGIRIPENYSGNAFRTDIYNETVNQEETQEKTEDITPPIPPQFPVMVPNDEKQNPDFNEKANPPQKSIFSSLLPSQATSSRFPFGHGIGSEELFILGIMLLVYTSNDNKPVDNELLMLLCILLFSG